MDSFCREQPSLLPPRFASRRAQGKPLKGHCISLWQVWAQELSSCVLLHFVAVLSPNECDTQSKRQGKSFRVREDRSITVKQPPLPSKDNLWSVAHLYVQVRVVYLLCSLYELVTSGKPGRGRPISMYTWTWPVNSSQGQGHSIPWGLAYCYEYQVIPTKHPQDAKRCTNFAFIIYHMKVFIFPCYGWGTWVLGIYLPLLKLHRSQG